MIEIGAPRLLLGVNDSDEDFLKVSCANVNSVFELFGGSGAYQGAKVGSELNNFVVNHCDRVGIVNLDEFDRLDSTVQDGLFTIFDKGEWVNKRLLRTQTETLDCRRIIWILTTNVFDNKIVSFCEGEDKCFKERKFKDIERKVKRIFQKEMVENFGKAMSRRLGSVIPFVPFTKEDCVAFVEDEIDRIA